MFPLNPDCCCDSCCCDCGHDACCCYDPENYYARPCPPKSCQPRPCQPKPCHPRPCPPRPCPPRPCQPSLGDVLCEAVGKKVIICINGCRLRVVICDVCGLFVQALRIGTGRTLYINIAKIDDIVFLC